MSLNVSLDISGKSHSRLPAVAAGILPVLSPDNVLAYLLINLLDVGGGLSDPSFLLGLNLNSYCLIQSFIHLLPMFTIIVRQSLQLKFLSHLQEPVKLLLMDLNLSMVNVVQDKLELPRGDSVKTEERMGVFVVGEDMFEVRTGG